MSLETSKEEVKAIAAFDMYIPKCSYSAYIDGYWSDWTACLTGLNEQEYQGLTNRCSRSYNGMSYVITPQVGSHLATGYCDICGLVNATGSYDGFSITYSTGNINYFSYITVPDKWDYVFKFKIDNFSEPSEAEKQRHINNKEWYVYSGTVEYFISDVHLKIEDVLSKYKRPVVPAKTNRGPVKRVVSKATIKIAPYSDKPYCYNFFFDNVGFGLDFGVEKGQVTLYKSPGYSDYQGVFTKESSLQFIYFYN